MSYYHKYLKYKKKYLEIKQLIPSNETLIGGSKTNNSTIELITKLKNQITSNANIINKYNTYDADAKKLATYINNNIDQTPINLIIIYINSNITQKNKLVFSEIIKNLNEINKLQKTI